MENKKAEILSAIKSIAQDIHPMPPATPATPEGVKVDIGGIHIRQTVSGRPECPRGAGPAGTTAPPLDVRRRDAQRRSVLRLLGIFLTFLAVLPLYLKHILPEHIDSAHLWTGLICLGCGMACFAAISVYENP
jgi:hypothetical protein